MIEPEVKALAEEYDINDLKFDGELWGCIYYKGDNGFEEVTVIWHRESGQVSVDGKVLGSVIQ